MKAKRSRKCAVWVILAVMIAFSCVRCQFSSEKKDVTDGKLPPTEASALWNHVTKTDPYKVWNLYPPKTGLYPSMQRGLIPAKNPHGAYLRLYGNEIAFGSAKEAENLPMPNGAILLKEDFGKDKTTLLSVTIMYKAEGYNPREGDWFWARYHPDGQVIDSGRVESCIECHRAKTRHDWRYTGATPHHHD